MTSIHTAAQSIAEQIALSMDGLSSKLGGESLYAFALVVTDDFAMVNKAVNTEAHYARSPGGPAFRWRVSEWQHNGMELDTDLFVELLGDPTYQVDPELQRQQTRAQAKWLMALIEGLKVARDAGHLCWREKPIAAFCTIEESDDAAWVERESARVVNPGELSASLEDELTAAQTGYESPEDNPSPLRWAFEILQAEHRRHP